MERAHKHAAGLGAVLAAGVGGLAYVASSFDWVTWGVNLTDAVLPSITILALYLVRLGLNNLSSLKIPRFLLPVAAVAIAAIGEWITTLVESGSASAIVVALTAGAATICYQIAKAITEHEAK